MEDDNFIQENKVYNLDAIEFLEYMYEDFGDESVNLFLFDLPYTYKGKQRVTANKWDLPINPDRMFELTSRLLTQDGALILTATNPFSAYMINKSIELQTHKTLKNINFVNFKYEWIWEKDNGSNFVHVKHQPFKVHEQILVFGKAPTTYNKKGLYMKYNPQFIYDKPYVMKRDMSDVTNLEGFKGRTDTSNKDGKRYPRSVQKFNLERGLHPTQKPTKLFDYIIRTYTNKGDLVVDCCVGSGTTAISCLNTNRKYIVNDNGIDKKTHRYWADITQKRINTYLNNI